MEFGNWLRARRQQLGFTQAVLAENVGVVLSTIRNWESATRMPRIGRSDQRALAQSLRLTLGQLEQIGRGEIEDAPMLAESASQSSAGIYRRSVPENLRHPSLLAIPVPNRTSAGPSTEHTHLDYAEGAAAHYVMVPPDTAISPDTFAVRVEGHSMSPHIEDGDWVICAPARGPLVAGAVYCIQNDGSGDYGNCIKFVRLHDEEHLELIPANGAYDRQIVRLDSCRLSRVLYRITAMTAMLRR